MIRPLFLEFPHATKDGHPVDLDAGSEFMLGPDLLIAPPPYPDEVDTYPLTLPGDSWYSFWSGKKLPPLPSEAELLAASNASPDKTTLQSPAMQQAMQAIRENSIQPKNDELPVYVRGGSMLPMQPLVQSTGETPQGPLELRVYPGKDCHGSIYLDDGHTFLYKRGEYLRQQFSCEQGPGGLTVTLAKSEGSFTPWWKQIDITIYGSIALLPARG